MKVRKIWMFLALILLGYSGGIITGVLVDVDTVYNTTIKKIKSKRSSGDLVIDMNVDTDKVKSKKEIREEKKADRQQDREIRRAARHN